MTENDNTPESTPEGESTPSAEAPESQHDSPEPQDTTSPGGDEPKLRSKEAAKYRAAARAAEAERDQFRDRLAAQQQAVIAQLADAEHVPAKVLDAAGLDPAALCDESGLLDATKAVEAIRSIRTEFGLPEGFRPNRAQGASGQPPPPAKPSIADALRGR